MTTKKGRTELALPVVPQLNPTRGLIPFSTRRALTRAERAIVDSSNQQRLALEAIWVRQRFANDKLAQIHVHVHATFDDTAGAMLALKERPGRTREHQAVLDQFTQHQLNLVGRHLTSTLEVSATHIGRILEESPYGPPPEPRGFWSRLLGG